MKILYFAWLRDHIGRAGEECFPPAHVRTLDQLRLWLCDQSPGHARSLSRTDILRYAVDLDFAGLDADITQAREVAFFPPVTGG